MNIFKPREYQLLAHEQIVNAFKRGVKLLMIMATGGGKSKTIVSFIEKYLPHYNWVLVVRKRDLVNQLANTVSEFNLDFGVFMANDNRYSPKKSIQICSIDTLDSRGILPFLFDQKDIVLIIDEADESLSDGYQEIITKYTKRHELAKPASFEFNIVKPLRPAFLIGLTATAFDKGLPHFDEYIEPVKPIDLRDKYKALVNYRYFIPKQLDLSDVRISKGEFNSHDLERKLNTPQEIKNCFEYWLRFGENRQTLVFTVNQNHAADFAKYINDYYGKEIAVAVDANSSSEFRFATYARFRRGEIRFIVNVRLVTRGVDIPEIGCILDCATTLSINLHIQKLGRGSRPNEVYPDCIVICCANNLINNGHFYQDRKINLKEDIKRKRSDFGEMMRICANCFRGADPVDFGTKNTCPFCGHFNGKIKQKEISAAAKKKIELEEASPEKIEQIKMINEFKKILWQYQNIGKTKYPYDIAKEKAQMNLIKKYGIYKVEKIKKCIGLSEIIIRQQKSLYDYVPLGGL